MGYHSSWRLASILLISCLAALLVLYRETAWAMYDQWMHTGTYGHALLVPPISLWLIWRQRARLIGQVPRPAPGFLVPFALTGLIWLLGELAAVNALTQFALVGMCVLTVPLLLGWSVTRILLFPLLFLFFSVPFGDFVIPKLMEWTAAFTVLGLRATGIPVYQEGLHFVIPSGRWSVVEACSGVRYLMASLVVGTLFAYLHYRSWRRRWLFVGVALVVPLLANWLRAYLIVMLGHLSGNELATGVDHLIYGWVFFGLVILIMFTIGMRWQEPETSPSLETGVLAEAAVSRPGRSALIALLLLAVLVAPHVYLRMIDEAMPDAMPVLKADTLAVGGWTLTEPPPVEWTPDFHNPSATLTVGLARGAQRIGIHIVYYRRQGFTRKLISSQNGWLKARDANWTLLDQGMTTVKAGAGPRELRGATLSRAPLTAGVGPARLKAWWTYWIDDRFLSSDYMGKFLLARSRLAGRGDESAAVFLYAIDPEAEAVLAEYLETAGAGLVALLKNAVPPAQGTFAAYTSTP